MDMTPSGLFIPRVINSTTPTSSNRCFRYVSRVINEKTGLRDRTQYWAENGMIRVVDENTGEVKTLSRREFILHAIAINDMIPFQPHADVRADHRRLVDGMEVVARAALDQGDPVSAILQGAVRNSRAAMRNELPPVPGNHLPIEAPEVVCELPLSIPVSPERGHEHG